MNEELIHACEVLRDFCKAKGETREGCSICPFEDTCINNWKVLDNLEECMDSFIYDIKATEKTVNYKGAFDDFYNTVCANFDDCKGCKYKRQTDLCPYEFMERCL